MYLYLPLLFRNINWAVLVLPAVYIVRYLYETSEYSKKLEIQQINNDGPEKMRKRQIDNAIDNIETIKLYCWESSFKSRIDKFTEEIDSNCYFLKIKQFYSNLPFVLLDKLTPYFIFIFIDYFLDLEIKHSNIVELISILATLSTDLKQIPHYDNESGQCMAAYRKIQAFLQLDEI